tara:strand:- start:142 stop:1245 length:1104 start_codon:yes stop_codon:yes gene_type:complete
MTKAAELAKMGEVLTNSQIGGRRNIIINGAMQVAQRGTTTTDSNGYGVDRFRGSIAAAVQYVSAYTQSTTTPTGFVNSLKVATTTAETTFATNFLSRMLYRIEGQDLQMLNWGSSDAIPLTLSFHVRSNLTGTYGMEFRCNDGENSTNTQTYTISSANTWEKKTILLPANTSASIDNDNSNGFEIGWCLSAGTNFTTGTQQSGYVNGPTTANRFAGHNVNHSNSTSNEWYVTGVQLELGTATPFEHRSFGEELALCQRYFSKTFPQGTTPVAGHNKYIYEHLEDYASGFSHLAYSYPVEMRTTPSTVMYTTADSNNGTGRVSYYDGAWKNAVASIMNTSNSANVNVQVDATAAIKLVEYNLTADAEL